MKQLVNDYVMRAQTDDYFDWTNGQPIVQIVLFILAVVRLRDCSKPEQRPKL